MRQLANGAKALVNPCLEAQQHACICPPPPHTQILTMTERHHECSAKFFRHIGQLSAPSTAGDSKSIVHQIPVPKLYACSCWTPTENSHVDTNLKTQPFPRWRGPPESFLLPPKGQNFFFLSSCITPSSNSGGPCTSPSCKATSQSVILQDFQLPGLIRCCRGDSSQHNLHNHVFNPEATPELS